MRDSSRNERRRRQRQRQRLILMGLGLMLLAIPLLGSALIPDPSNNWVQVPEDFYHADWMGHLSEVQSLKPLPLGPEDASLHQALNNLLAQYPPVFKPHLFYMNLKDGRWVSIHGDDAVPAASVIKLPVLMSYFQTLDAGELTPYTHIMYDAFEQADGSGMLQYQTPGKPLLADHVATEMIQNSDNTCTNMLIYQLGGSEQLNTRFTEWGLKRTHIQNWLPDLTGTNMVSMQDTATILYNIYEGNGISPASRARALEILKGTHNRRLIPGLLPQDTVLAHKTGDIGTALGDSGLVFMPNGQDFILTIQVERPYNNYTGKDMIQQVAKVVYDHQAQALPDVASN